MKSVGKGVSKIDSLALVTGKPVYTDDLAFRNALIIKILRSPHAFARIKNIDISRALKLPGVECILTYKDAPKTRFTLAGQTYPEPSPYDRLILEEIVRYVGDAVAVIAAVDEKTASRALNLIDVRYEVLEPVLDFEKAIDNPSIVHPEKDVHINFPTGENIERNIVCTIDESFGNNCEDELAKSPVIVENTYYTQAQAHSMMETFSGFSYLDPNGRLVVTSSTQVPFHIKRQLARALEIPASKIRVVKPRVGGGFGGKQSSVVEIFTAIVTLKTGKPAKIVYERKETFECTNTRHAMRIKVTMGAEKDGTINAIKMEALSDQGAYGEHSFTTLGLVAEKTMPLYNRAKAYKFFGQAVYTNKVIGAAFRGYGATQGTFALESSMNELAARLNMDPIELRLKNLVECAETTVAYNKPIRSIALKECIAKGKELIGWAEKYPSKEISPNKVRAVGMAVTMQGSGVANIDSASVEIKLNECGDYTLLMSATDVGMGCDTILAQMAAEVLDTSLDNITVIAADTDVTPYDPGSYASSGTYVTGMAVVKAAEDLKNQIVEEAARILNLPLDALEFSEDKILIKDSTAVLLLKDLSERLTSGVHGKNLIGCGNHGSDVTPPPYMAGFAEIELDKETGKVEMINYAGVVDCGTVINPNLARIQAEGGIVQGIGYALYEDVKHDFHGRLQTNSFMQYKIPTRKDIGNIIVDFEPSYEPTGPFGAKSIGEIVINTPAPAIAAAVYNAVGVNIRRLPVTPEKVFMAMNKK
ncbi:MAG: molybdopterin cofactor-binding domain-containing protein [Clostridiaceae bacterium]